MVGEIRGCILIRNVIGALALIVLGVIFSCPEKIFAQEQNILVSEICSHPDTGEVEYIELYNPLEEAVDLSVYSLEDGTHKAKVLTGYLEPDTFFVIEKGASGFSFSLNDSGDEVILRKGQEIADWVSYGAWDDGSNNPDNNAPLPPLGKSISRYPNESNSGINKTDFVISLQNKGTAYQKPTYSDQIKISEVVPEPTAGTAYEYIEIVNIGTEQVDLSAWVLDDIDGGSPPYQILEDTQIAAGEYIIFYNSDTSLALNDTGDCARLLDPNGEIKDSVCYSTARKGESYSKFSEGWMWTLDNTPLAANILHLLATDSDESLTPVAISDAKKLEIGENVAVSGIVSVVPGILSGQYFYLQDDSGGIQVYCYSGDFIPMQAGDRVITRGELSAINGEKRIKISLASDITLISSGEEIIPQVKPPASISDEDVGKVITTLGRVSYTSGDVFIVSDEKDIKIIIKKSTNIKKPRMARGDEVRVTGVLSNYRGELRILPFYQSGVTILTSGKLPVTGGSAEEVIKWNSFQKVYPIPQIILLISALIYGVAILWHFRESWVVEKPHQLKL